MITRTATTKDLSATQAALTVALLQQSAAGQSASGYRAMTERTSDGCFNHASRWSGRDYHHQIEQASRKVSAA